jgi:hypothetical protein
VAETYKDWYLLFGYQFFILINDEIKIGSLYPETFVIRE